MMVRFKFVALLSLFAVLVAGCTSSHQQLYYWDSSYSKSVYEYLNQEGDINAHIANLENLAKNAQAKGMKVPPGVHAHLGLLYLNLGDKAGSKANFDKEAELFPESRTYIEFLKQQSKKGVKDVKKG